LRRVSGGGSAMTIEDYFDRRRYGEAHVKRLVRQLERLGHKVALEHLPRSVEEAVTRPDFHTRLGASPNVGRKGFPADRIVVSIPRVLLLASQKSEPPIYRRRG